MIVMQHYELSDLPDIQKVGVYAIHNKRNDRYYIGSTKNLYHRFMLHMRALRHLEGVNRKMDEDFRFFEDFEWIVIETFEDYTITNDDLRWKERHYIEYYKAIENGYNTDYPNTGNIPENELLAPRDYMSERQKRSIKIYIPHSVKERYRQYAAAHGYKSLTSYIDALIMRDNPTENGGK